MTVIIEEKLVITLNIEWFFELDRAIVDALNDFECYTLSDLLMFDINALMQTLNIDEKKAKKINDLACNAVRLIKDGKVDIRY